MNRYHLEAVGEVITPLNDTLLVQRGWDNDLAHLLVEQSKQAEILKWTPRDAAERFSTIMSAESWYNQETKRPVVYSLGLATNQLAGMAWFSRQATDLAPEADLTFGIRLYDGFNGQGLSRPFAQIVHEDMDTMHGSGVWLETTADNLVAQKLYKNVGYIAVGKHADRVVMVRSPQI